MKGFLVRLLGGTLGIAATAALMTASPAAAAVTHSTGMLADGAMWVADVPSNWNGTLLLYSHGFGPTVAADAPDSPSLPNNPAGGPAYHELLNEGYALAGSSYDPHGSWWALGSAVRDQFQTEAVVKKTLLPSPPRDVYAFGTSMGGLISALEDQNSNGQLNGSLTTCGIVAGATNLNQYQLDGEYAMAELLAPSLNIKLTGYTVGPSGGFADSGAAAAQLGAAATAAQATPAGQARLALGMAYMNVSPWGGATVPSIYDYVGQEAGQFQDLFTSPAPTVPTALGFIMTAREQLEAAAGGDSAGTIGVDFKRLIQQSSYYPEVRALYHEAGLSLESDLQTLEQNANIAPNPSAYRWLRQTSVPTGHLQVPELDLKTLSDQLVPVQQERWYAQLVRSEGDSDLLRQAFANAQGHCNFTPADLVAGVHALASRVSSGSWGNLATAGSLDAAANGLSSTLGGGNFLPYWPERLTAAVSPFDGFGDLWPRP